MKRFLLLSLTSVSAWVLFVGGCSSSGGGGAGAACGDAGAVCAQGQVCENGACVTPPGTGGSGTGGTGTGGTGTGGTGTGGTGTGGTGGADCLTVCQDCGGGDVCDTLCASATPSQLACAQAALPDCAAAQQCFLGGTGGTGGGTGGIGGTGGGSGCGSLTFTAPACQSCMEANCCNELLNCDTGSSCQDLLACLQQNNCLTATDPNACAEQYCSAYVAGATTFNAVNECGGTYCPSECGG